MARVLIIHGWTNRRPEGHWQRRLASALRDQGHIVSYPQFPNTDDPQLSEWLEVAVAELQQLTEVSDRRSEPLVVVAHSLGCVAWMHIALQGLAPEGAERVLLVAPPERAPISPVPSFVANDSDATIAEALRQSAGEIVVVGSDLDPWQPSGIQAGVATPLGLTAVVIPGAQHFTVDNGFGQWQGVIDWVNDEYADLRVI
jgi:predicted alpha/beta hydrolase family esterase